ncbi:hypothetical protein A3K72_00990 [Candidatus Woesearchaeota archaeon RBG_13_36_6]|nr:MAG: hypothetical protein A3K72_00990 [Candidatus Woesearchaeota archaeon RBG_13_36_6]HJX50569.1 polysaccharide deacetylase family protein [Candidatus Nanoarchaeia archaeon]
MKKGRVIIYWDYELQKGADMDNSKSWGLEDYKQTKWLLKTLEKYDVKCCFAVLGYAAEKGELPYNASEQIKKMAEEGHEIASHSYTHRELTKLNEKEIVWELKKSKEVLEKLTGKKVVTFVPPWNKPFSFFGLSVDAGKKPMPWIWPSKLKISRLCELLYKTGYKKCRLYNIHNKIFRRNIASEIKEIKGIECYYSNTGSGFGKDARGCVLSSIKENKVAVLYEHPHQLKCKNVRMNFLDLMKFINKIVV